MKTRINVPQAGGRGEEGYAYSRAQAIADGVLIDVGEIAHKCGFRFPVAVTARVWAEVVSPPDPARAAGHTLANRVREIVWALFCALRRAKSCDNILFVTAVDVDHAVTLKALCGPGDNAEPVITIMFPDED